MGTAFLFSPFAQLYLTAHIYPSEKMRESSWCNRERTGRKAKHGILGLADSPRGQVRDWVPEFWNRSLDCPLDHLGMRSNACTGHREPSGTVEEQATGVFESVMHTVGYLSSPLTSEHCVAVFKEWRSLPHNHASGAVIVTSVILYESWLGGWLVIS